MSVIKASASNKKVDKMTVFENNDIKAIDLAIAVIECMETMANQRNDATAGNAFTNALAIVKLAKENDINKLKEKLEYFEVKVW